ncbi:MAG: hypothetical protein ACQETH_03695 [Candidatus Rifleibacteriota bacterium]
MKSIKITFFLLFSILFCFFILAAQSRQKDAAEHSHPATVNSLEKDHILEQHQHDQYEHDDHVTHHHRDHDDQSIHHHDHKHEHGVGICPHCGHAHHVEDQIVKYETLNAKYTLLKNKALLFFILAFCLVLFNWLFQKKLKRG